MTALQPFSRPENPEKGAPRARGLRPGLFAFLGGRGSAERGWGQRCDGGGVSLARHRCRFRA